MLAQQLHDHVGLVRYAPPELVHPAGSSRSAGDFARDLAAALKALTGTAWQVDAVATRPASRPCSSRSKAEAEALRQTVLDSPVVKAAFEAFPDAELAGYTIDDQRSA